MYPKNQKSDNEPILSGHLWAYILLTSFFFLFAQMVFAQNSLSVGNLKFTHIGPSQGLANPKVTDLYQDSYGFIWIGTEYGLYRFNGYECTDWTTIPGDTSSISANHISYQMAFHEDENHNLFIATFNGGLNYFDRKKEKFTRYLAGDYDYNSLSSNAINAITGDRRGGLWVATNGRGLNHFDPKSGKFKWYWSEKDNPDTLVGEGTLVTLLLDKNGLLWIGTGNGLSCFDPGKEHFERYYPDASDPNSLSGEFVTSILEDSMGRVWVACMDGLNLWDNGNFKRFYPNENLPYRNDNYNYITNLFEDSEGNLWAGTIAGLLHWEVTGNEVQFTPVLHNPADPKSISKGSIHGILEDRLGNLMFGTEDGVSILNKTAVHFMDQRFSHLQGAFPSIGDGESFRAAIEVNNNLWFCNDKGIFIYELNKQPRQILKDKVTALYSGKNGRVYAGTVESSIAFYILDPKSGQIIERHERVRKPEPTAFEFQGSRIETFVEDNKGFVWMATKSVLTRFDPETKLFQRFYSHKDKPKSLTNSSINDLHLDMIGQLWVATDAGLNRLDTAQLAKPFGDELLFDHYRYDLNEESSLSSDLVFCLLEDADGYIWAGTETGLNRFDPQTNRWDRFFKENGLPGNKITDLIEDSHNNLWTCTANNGIAKYDGKNFMRFTAEDGLHSNHFTKKASFNMQDGTLVFCNTEGVNAFQTTDLTTKEGPLPPVYFTDFQIFNKYVPPDGKDSLLKKAIYLMPDITLKFSQRVFSFKIAALDYARPRRQQYRYRLESFGGNTAWISLNNNRLITLSNLLPGEHHLYVQASADGKVWHSPDKALRIVVRPPWWGSWWAILFYIFLILGIIYFTYRFRLRQKLAGAEARRLRELDQVKNRLYTNITHEFRTPLTIILGVVDRLYGQVGYAARESLKMVGRNGRQLLDLVNQMLDLAKLESGALRPNMVQSDVILFLKYLLESFHSMADSKDISLRFASPTDSFTMDYDPERLRQIVSNLLSNALKFTPSGGEVSLTVDVTDFENLSHLNLAVTDTGKGIPPEKLPHIFDRFYQADDSATRQAEGTGIGLTLTKELIKLLGGEINVESEMGRGTKFTVTLPVAKHEKPQAGVRIVASVPAPSMLAADPEMVNPHLSKPTASPSLLIIEDNADVVRYVSQVLQNSYQLAIAPNGKAGVEKAKQEMPDLIISDVMMPEMDGFEVCRWLKNDASTSHIPIVLLTARADAESKIKGLEQGADAYLPKPFYERELKATLKNLLENREKLRHYYTSGEFLGSGKSPVNASSANRINPQDEAFLKKILQTVEAHLDDRKLSAEKLAELMLTSYSNLYKKTSALTGMHVTEYIRHIRLHKAAAMLKENGELTISQISLEVGFNSLQFFSREFRKVFGISPSAYRKGQNKK